MQCECECEYIYNRLLGVRVVSEHVIVQLAVGGGDDADDDGLDADHVRGVA